MIKRTMDATFLNKVANHPEVRPWLGGDGVLNLEGLAADPANILLETDGGGWVLHAIMPSVYELHTMFLPEGRGRAYFAAAREALRWMFSRTDALEIVTKCPDDNGPARMAASVIGFRERFRREDAWAPGVGISYQVFSVDDWFVRDKECLTAGRAFHEALEAAKVAAGSTLPVHPEDEAHDRAVGACALMIQGGYLAKGVSFYNRWSIFAGYATIEALSPTLVDVRDAIVEVRDGQMGVLKCRLAPQLQESEPPPA
jgi:hypothetical protein